MISKGHSSIKTLFSSVKSNLKLFKSIVINTIKIKTLVVVFSKTSFPVKFLLGRLFYSYETCSNINCKDNKKLTSKNLKYSLKSMPL